MYPFNKHLLRVYYIPGCCAFRAPGGWHLVEAQSTCLFNKPVVFSLVIEGDVVFSSCHVLTRANKDPVFLDKFFEYFIRIYKIFLRFI